MVFISQQPLRNFKELSSRPPLFSRTFFGGGRGAWSPSTTRRWLLRNCCSSSIMFSLLGTCSHGVVSPCFRSMPRRDHCLSGSGDFGEGYRSWSHDSALSFNNHAWVLNVCSSTVQPFPQPFSCLSPRSRASTRKRERSMNVPIPSTRKLLAPTTRVWPSRLTTGLCCRVRR